MHALAWMNPENSMLSDRIQTRKATHHTVPFTITVQKRQIHRDRMSLVVAWSQKVEK